jgi:hypothetical protein
MEVSVWTCSEDATNKDALDEEKQRRQHKLKRNMSSGEGGAVPVVPAALWPASSCRWSTETDVGSRPYGSMSCLLLSAAEDMFRRWAATLAVSLWHHARG